MSTQLMIYFGCLLAASFVEPLWSSLLDETICISLQGIRSIVSPHVRTESGHEVKVKASQFYVGLSFQYWTSFENKFASTASVGSAGTEFLELVNDLFEVHSLKEPLWVSLFPSQTVDWSAGWLACAGWSLGEGERDVQKPSWHWWAHNLWFILAVCPPAPPPKKKSLRTLTTFWGFYYSSLGTSTFTKPGCCPGGQVLGGGRFLHLDSAAEFQ